MKLKSAGQCVNCLISILIFKMLLIWFRPQHIISPFLIFILRTDYNSRIVMKGKSVLNSPSVVVNEV